MNISQKRTIKFFLILFFVIISIFFFSINKYNKEKNKTLASEPIIINLLTSTHPNLLWKFKAAKQKVVLKPGEVVPIEYLVENLGNKDSTGIATFAYYPKEFGNYISKLNCFCYDAQTLKSGEEDVFTLVLMVDPEVTKDSKTKNVKEVTIQFTFFDYKEYKENKS